MNIDFLVNYAVPVIVGICLCVGYILKNIVTSEKINRFIPLIMGVLGLVLNIWINGDITPDIILGGLFSGLAATGMHQLFTRLINKGDDTNA